MKHPFIYSIIGFVCFIITFSACKQERDVEFGNLPTALVDSLKQMGQKFQLMEIDPAKDNVIKGKNGTVIYISANSLLNGSGQPASSKAIIELKEHYLIADFVSSNLQTVHNDDILQTQGMIYLSAKEEDGSPLKIDQTKPVRIEVPVKEKIVGAKIFTGQRDGAGNINWDEIREPSKNLVPFPIHYISRDGFGECAQFYGITKDTIKNKYYTLYGDLLKYENTFLATREFRERYDTACWKDVLAIYVKNLDKNLWEVDELLVKHFIQDSIKNVKYIADWRPPGIHGGPRTKEQDEAHAWLLNSAKTSGHRRIMTFKNFSQEKLTRIDPSKRIADTTIVEVNKIFVSYDAQEFGWVNVDYFYRDPNATDIKLIAKTNEEAPMVHLIFPKRNIILSGIIKDNGEYWFTKKVDGYNKLPRGEKAIIIAIAIVDNQLHFANKEIVIGQNEIEKLELKKSTSKEIVARLKNAN